MGEQNVRDLKLDNLALWCAVFVISQHCDFNVANSGLVWWLDKIFSHGYSLMAVPMFFVLSGYFLAKATNRENWYRIAIKKRARSLLVPYFLWIIIHQLIFAPISILADYKAGRAFGTSVALINHNAWQVWGLDLTTTPVFGPMWYLRSLFLLVLVSWGLCFAVRRFPILTIAGSLIVAIIFPARFELLFFISGLYLGLTGIAFRNRWLAICSLVVGASLLFINIAISFPGMQLIMIAAFMYATWYYMPKGQIPTFLKGMAFPIYLIHFIPVTFIRLIYRGGGGARFVDSSCLAIADFDKYYYGAYHKIFVSKTIRNNVRR